MAQKTQFYGGLIYFGIPSGTLAKCSCIIADTLEEYGHSVDQFSARASDVIALTCDHYRLVLRMGDQPDTPEEPQIQPSLQRVEITLQPIFPTHCDTELSEMLMAIIMYRLVPVLAAEHVEWMDPSATLTRSQFLSAFDNVNSMQPQPLTLAQPRFAPIEETAAELERHCSKIQASAFQSPVPVARVASYQRLTAWAGSLMRGSEHRLVSLIPPLSACAALLKSSGSL